jgi:hypothetical protein
MMSAQSSPRPSQGEGRRFESLSAHPLVIACRLSASRDDGEYPALSLDPLQAAQTAVDEAEAGPGHDVPDRLRDKHVAAGSLGQIRAAM